MPARAAVDAGAENVTLCDTNGGSLPEQVAEATEAVVARSASRVEIGIHAHNDADCGVANSLAAVRAGARLVQGTINGYGERCGNANLASILPALQLKMGFEVVSAEQLASLTETAHFIDELCNLTPDPDAPYVGRNAFAHKGGMHVAGVDGRRPHLRAHRPGRGRQRARDPALGALRQGDDPQPGRAGRDRDRRGEGAARAVEQLKEREHRGYHYEAAPASFELLLRREAGVYQATLRAGELPGRDRAAGGRGGRNRGDDQGAGRRRALRPLAEGNGPVNALDRALRRAIADRYPQLAEIELTNYKVRILDETHGTDAVTRVLLDSADGEREWGTIGVSENIIEASWEALVDSLEYAFQPGRTERQVGWRRRDGRLSDTAGDPAFARPEIGAREEELALEVLRSGRLSLGPMGERFEREFADLARGRGRGRCLQRHGGAPPRRAGARLGAGR